MNRLNTCLLVLLLSASLCLAEKTYTVVETSDAAFNEALSKATNPVTVTVKNEKEGGLGGTCNGCGIEEGKCGICTMRFCEPNEAPNEGVLCNVITPKNMYKLEHNQKTTFVAWNFKYNKIDSKISPWSLVVSWVRFELNK